jgi:hypothetical protein
MGDLDPYSPAEMVTLARRALEAWRAAGSGTAAERKAARTLAFAVGRLDSLGALSGPLPPLPEDSQAIRAAILDRVDKSPRSQWIRAAYDLGYSDARRPPP